MTLTLHYHPLSSYCWKALIALHESATPFRPEIVDFGNPDSVARFAAVWPMTQMPVLRDEARDRTVPEASIIVEYLDRHYPGPAPLIPLDPGAALNVRLADRFFDLHIQSVSQKIVGDRIRPADSRDPHGVADARRRLDIACNFAEREVTGEGWYSGENFGLADIAALPALYYVDRLAPLAGRYPRLAGYLQRLLGRPSIARVVADAQPYAHMFPV